LYEGLDPKQTKRLLDVKNDLVKYLVRRSRYDGYEKTHADARIKQDSYLQRLSVDIREFSDKRVLEVGSGHSAALFCCGAKEVVNIDPLMDIYKRYVKGFPEKFAGISFKQGSAESLPVED
jgi:ubiquinone/menaquinone biosynthesis C-methylase UbiE